MIRYFKVLFCLNSYIIVYNVYPHVTIDLNIWMTNFRHTIYLLSTHLNFPKCADIWSISVPEIGVCFFSYKKTWKKKNPIFIWSFKKCYSGRNVSKVYKVPRSILQDLVEGKTSLNRKSGPDTILSPEEEYMVVTWLFRIWGCGFLATKTQLQIVFSF